MVLAFHFLILSLKDRTPGHCIVESYSFGRYEIHSIAPGCLLIETAGQFRYHLS